MTESSIRSDARAARLDILRARLSAIVAPPGCDAVLPFGVEMIDHRLAGGGLALAALHEVAGLGDGLPDETAASLFAAGIAGRAPGATVLWVLARRTLFAPGLEQAGLLPARLIQAEAGRDADILAVMEDALAAGGIAAVVGEVDRAGTVATRRLQLAAASGTTPALLLRRVRGALDPFAEPSAAATRWRIGPLPSAALAVPGVGRARWRVELTRQRGGAAHDWIMEACDEEGRLALPADARDRSAATAGAATRHAA